MNGMHCEHCWGAMPSKRRDATTCSTTCRVAEWRISKMPPEQRCRRWYRGTALDRLLAKRDAKRRRTCSDYDARVADYDARVAREQAVARELARATAAATAASRPSQKRSKSRSPAASKCNGSRKAGAR